MVLSAIRGRTTRLVSFVGLGLLAALVVHVHGAPSRTCLFARTSDPKDLLLSPRARQEFLENVMFWEGQFHQDQIGMDAGTGMTYDGHRLDVITGLPIGTPHLFTAPSKESLHVALLARALDGDSLAQLWVSPSNASKAIDMALDILTRKVGTYEDFANRYPGYGGFMPWTAVMPGKQIDPTWDWVGKVPSLDNGQLLWSAIVLSDVLRVKYGGTHRDLVVRWEAVWKTMVQNALTIFFEPSVNRFRAVVNISNPQQKVPSRDNYACAVGCSYLDDPYEGELLVMAAYLFSDWSPYASGARADVWVQKRDKFQAVQFPTSSSGNITVQRGWWYSAHEVWKFMLAPYLRVDIQRRIFLNGERARTWFSKERGIPGLYASVNAPFYHNTDNFGYYSACGIQELAFQPVVYNTTVTPYGAWALLMADLPAGLAWYREMIASARGQNCYGSTESLNTTGATVAALVTWDSKITSVLGMLGGIGDLAEQALRRLGTGYWDAFSSILETEGMRIFASMQGENLPFQLPAASIARVLPDFASCSSNSCPQGK